MVLDRDGQLLRAFTMPDGRWRLPVTAQDVDPRFIAMLLAYEDHRFYTHRGVDPEALGRAALQFATRGRIVSGGSTLTMQVARLLEPRKEKSVASKVRQMARALQLESQYAKSIILDLYLGLAPYGGNIEGVRAASLAYFGKEPKRLSVAEAALLVALPQSPEARRPDRFPGHMRAPRATVCWRVPIVVASSLWSSVTKPCSKTCRMRGWPFHTSRRTQPRQRYARIRSMAFII